MAWAFALDGEWDIEISFACMNMKLRNISHVYTIPQVAYADLDSVAHMHIHESMWAASHSDTPPNSQMPPTCLGGYRTLALLQDPRSWEGLGSALRGQSRAVTIRSETEYKLNLRPKPKTSSQTTHQRFRPGAHEHSSSCCRATLTVVRNIGIWGSERICACRYIDYLVGRAYLVEHTDEGRSERKDKYP